MTGSNSSLSERIREARTLNGVSPEEPLTAYPSIGAVLREQADQREDQTFLVAYTEDGQRREYTYAEFLEQVSRAAGVLKSHGVIRGDRIAILSFNAAEVVILYFAVWLTGAVVVPVNADEDDRRLSYVLSSSGASLILVRDDQLQRLLEIRKEIPAPGNGCSGRSAPLRRPSALSVGSRATAGAFCARRKSRGRRMTRSSCTPPEPRAIRRASP